MGVEEGGLHSAEALMLARYFMYAQMYFHPVRRIYDIHLKEFLKEWLNGDQFSTEIEAHLIITDAEVTAAILASSMDSSRPGHTQAGRIAFRRHFKLVYERSQNLVEANPDAGNAVCSALLEEFGSIKIRRDRYSQISGAPDFSVVLRNGQIMSSLSISQALSTIPVVSVDFVFADRSIHKKADEYLQNEHDQIFNLKRGKQ